MKIKIKRIGDGIPGPLPTRASDGAACYDVVATKIEKIGTALIEVYLGFATEIPKEYKGCVVPRSSFTHKSWVLQNSPAQIDPDYRGEWKLKFQQINGGVAFPYEVGDRVAQIYFEKIEPVEFVLSLDDLEETKRGVEGFGSTGKKMIR